MFDKIKKYATIRNSYLQDKEALNAIIEDAKATLAYQTIMEAVESHAHVLDTLATEIRDAAIAKFKADGNKKPWDGIGIRETTKVDYDNALAFDWCKTNLPDVLTIDSKKFNKVITAMDDAGADLPGHITVSKVATATISADLSAYLD